MLIGNIARRVNKQNFTVIFKKLFLFYLTVLFCCNVGDSDLGLKPTGPLLRGPIQKCGYTSENEAVKSSYNWVIYPLTQPKVATQKKRLISRTVRSRIPD